MNLEESKAHLEQANEERMLGIGWDEITRLQSKGTSKLARKLRNPRKAQIAGRPCVKCGKPSGNVGLLPHCKKCLKA